MLDPGNIKAEDNPGPIIDLGNLLLDQIRRPKRFLIWLRRLARERTTQIEPIADY